MSFDATKSARAQACSRSPHTKISQPAKSGATIIRRKLATNFTILPNEIFDLAIGDLAFRTLAYLLSKPPDWQVIPDQLRTQFRCSRKKVYRALNELIAVRHVRRSKSADGSTSYTVFDQPTDPSGRNGKQAQESLLAKMGNREPSGHFGKEQKRPLSTKKDRITKTDREERKVLSTEQTLAPSALADDGAPLFGGKANGSRQASKASTAAFDQFWTIYPKRVGKLAAAKAWDKALKQATADQIIDGARRYAVERQDENPQYTKHPSTWLNGGHWMDDPQRRAEENLSFMDIAAECRNETINFEDNFNGTNIDLTAAETSEVMP